MMIFVTIGTQEPFDRLIRAVDKIVPLLDGVKVVAQVAKSDYKAQNMETFEFIPPAQFDEYFSKARLIVGHAGMGTIISALMEEKPILVMPRIASLGEHRNDHQMATAKRFEELNYIEVAYNGEDLQSKIQSILFEELKPLHKIGKSASMELIGSIKSFIAG